MLSAVLLSLTVAVAEPQVKEPPAKLELFAAEDWYRGQKGKEEEFVGVLERVKGGGVGFGRFNPYHLRMEKDVREVYVGGKPDLLAPYVGRKVKLIGKAVDMEVEGQQHREIWPARLEVSATEEQPKEPPAKADILANHKLYKMEPGQEKTFVGVLRKGEKGGYYLELTAEKAVGREDLVLYGDAGDPLAPYVGKRVKIVGKQVRGAVGMRTFQHTLPGTLEVLPAEKEKPLDEESARRAKELEAQLEKVEARLDSLRRREIEVRRQLTDAAGADERRTLEAELERTISATQESLLLKARLRRDLLQLQRFDPPGRPEKE
jgi:hypothetical protein